MRVFSTIGRSLPAFVGDTRGSFAVLTGAILTVLVLSAGFALNLAQLYNVKSSLQQALDSALTSTARDITTGTIEPDEARGMVEAFLKANGDPELIRSDRLVLDSLVIDQLNNTIEATAYVDVDLFFPLFGLSDQRRVSNLSATVYSDRNIEVAMMLDVTGSMGGQKIEDLKDAAENAVEALLGNQDARNPRVRVAIVPYAEAVNTGKLADTVFIEKKGGSNLPPTGKAETVSAKGRIDNCATERKDKDGAADFSDDGPDSKRTNKKGKTYLAKVNRDDRISIDPDTKKTMCPAAELIPLTADKQKLLDTIEDFEADGVTAGGIAAQWGYYMLSPKWRSAIKEAGMGAGPADHDRRRVAKVAILMTDGQFNTAFAGVKNSDTPQMRQGTKSRSYAEKLCANMKLDGIDVFTIGFALDDPEMGHEEREQAKSVLKNCSSPDSTAIKHYFEASTGEELDAAFKEIIANTERLAITR